MLLHIALIIGGVSFFIWLSTFGDNDIVSKMEFYSTNAGSLVAMFLLMVPFVFTFKYVNSSPSGMRRSNKQIAIAITIMISLQAIVAAYAPMIVSQYQKAGKTTADLIIKSKNQ